ncbi:hypothetical protein V1507DRAFT_467135 [Lipomyces tetrasporus]
MANAPLMSYLQYALPAIPTSPPPNPTRNTSNTAYVDSTSTSAVTGIYRASRERTRRAPTFYVGKLPRLSRTAQSD